MSDKSDIGELNLHCFSSPQHNVKSAKSKAILRQDKLSRIFVGAGALDSSLGGARFELSRAYVENIMWITQMRL